MANAKNVEVKVIVEKVIRGAMQEVIMSIAEQYELYVDEVRVEWIDTSTYEKNSKILTSMSLTTTGITHMDDPEG